MTTSWQVATLEELERLPVDEEGLVWRPVRRHFGIEAFGVNAYTAAAVGDRVVERHTERRNQHEELYFVAFGRARFTLDGEEVDAPAGTFVFVPPEIERGAVAAEPSTTVLALGGKRGEPFRVSAWEASFAASVYARQGDVARARETIRAALARYPDDWSTHYNLACFESLAGERDSALEHLHRAIELDAEARELARTDSDLDPIRDDPRFPP